MPALVHAQPPGHPLHLVQRGHCRAALFFCARDRVAYLHWLGSSAVHTDCAVHAYVLMGNHVHLLATPYKADGASLLMRALAERYAQYIESFHGRGGPMFEQRFKALVIRSNRHLIECMRYIELNPVRAHLAGAPDAYRWSSFHANALGHPDALVTPHPAYYALGRTAAARQAAYRQLFEIQSGRMCAPRGITRGRNAC